MLFSPSPFRSSQERGLFSFSKPLKHAYQFLLFLFFCLVSITVNGQSSRDAFDYQLSWSGKGTKLYVKVAYDSHGSDSTVFQYGDAQLGGQSRIFDIISHIKSGKGDLVSIDKMERKIVVAHATGGKKNLEYELDGELIVDAGKARPNELFRPVISTGSLYLIGYNLFLTVRDTAYKSITVKFIEWPHGMPYLISSDPNAIPGDRQSLTIEKMGSLMIVMDRQIVKKQYQVYGSPYYAITSKRDTLNDMQKELAPFFQLYFPSVHDFWQDYKKEDYFIGMLPLINNAPSTATGINLGKGFSMKYSGPYNDMKQEVIAHETSHTYIGQALSLYSKGFETAWFSEGFNDYISVYNLARTGMMNKTAFLEHMNKGNFYKHYTNPDNTAPADSIEKYFWSKHSFEVLSYQRGFIYAFYLDNQIRLTSGGKKNIRHFLQSFYQNTRGFNRPITTQDFLDAAGKFLPEKQVEKEVEKYMFKGDLMDFRSIKLIPEFVLHFDGDVPVLNLSEHADLQKIYNW